MIKSGQISKKEIVKYLIEKLTKNRIRLKSLNIDYPTYEPGGFSREDGVTRAITDEVWTITFRPKKRMRKNA
jgi:hypothetical protein